MNNNTWKALLEQTSSNNYNFIIERSPKKININIIDKTTGKSPKGKPNQYGELTKNAHMKLIKRGSEGSWEVVSIISPKGSSGVGKELYLLALELVSTSGLSPDSVDISPNAKNLWNNFLKKHELVSYREKESEKDTSEDDPFKYIWTIDPSYESPLNIDYKKIEKEEEPAEEWNIPPYDPFEDGDDNFEDIYEENFQQDVKKNYSKMKFKIIGMGGNRYNVAKKMKKPSYKRSKSSPPGFGGT